MVTVINRLATLFTSQAATANCLPYDGDGLAWPGEVVGFRVSARDSAATHSIELRLVDPHGKLVVPPATLGFQSSGTPPPDQEVSVPTVTFLSPAYAQPRAYSVEYWHEGKLLTSVM